MKKVIPFFLFLLFLITVPGCGLSKESALPASQPTEETAAAAETFPTEPEELILTAPVLELSSEEKEMLLRIGMAERGYSGCPECIALVMRTILNRVESGRFGSSIRKVLFAQDQFTPVSTGYYYKVKPNECCYDALEMVIYGWDESQGCLYYEWCKGESWHSQNLNLLFQHCDTRFYD